MHSNQISSQIIAASIKVHQKLGPGLLESVYETCLAYELQKQGLTVQRQVPIAIQYDDITFQEAFRADIIINDTIILELKSVAELHPVHKKQLLTYLKLSGKKLGLLLNFNEDLMKNGICRVINGFL